LACYIVGHSMMSKSGPFRRTVIATTYPTAVPVSLFLVSTDRDARRHAPRRRRRYKSDEQIQISSPAKTASAPYSQPDWLPPRSQTHRVTLPRKGKLLCGKFPGVSFWQRTAMFYFNPKVSIEVCLYHRNVTPVYGDGLVVSRSDRVSCAISIFDSMHF
jgi:hypothetical protein